MTLTTLTRIRTGVLFLCLLFSYSFVCAQTQSVHAVYAGSEYNNNLDAGIMERFDYVYYFRPNNSFCSELDKPDWQTKVNGTYTISGNQLKMKFLGDGSERIILLSVTGETGQSGAATFVRLEPTDKVPAGYFKYVRTSGRQDALYFTDAGRFSQNRINANAVPSNGGKNDDEGSFSISKSQLSLKYDNGRTTTYSFFTSKEKSGIAVIDGRIYYLDEGGNASASEPVAAAPKTVAGDNLDAGINLLQNANKSHGGKSLDNLVTLKAVMSTNNLTLTMLADYQKKVVRLESSLQGNMILVEQLEGNSGWSFDGNGFTTLSPQRVIELKRFLYCGLAGLKTDILAKTTATLQTQQFELSSIMVMVDNFRAGYIINNRNSRLEALIMADVNHNTTTVTYSDYKKVDNILLPFTEIIQAGKHAQTISYDKYEINPSLSQQAWARPKS
jgi:hypothetical protein